MWRMCRNGVRAGSAEPGRGLPRATAHLSMSAEGPSEYPGGKGPKLGLGCVFVDANDFSVETGDSREGS